MLHVQEKTGPALGWLESAFGAAAFEPLKLSGTPLLVLAGDPLDLIWANGAASNVFRATDNAALARLIFGLTADPRQRLDILRSRLAPGSPPRLERMRLVSGLALHSVTALCCGAQTPLGNGLALAFPGLGSGSEPWWQAHGEPHSAAPIDDASASVSALAASPDSPDPPVGNGMDDLRLRLRAAFGGRDQRRFLWRTDAAGRLVQIDDGLFDDLGAVTRPLLQHALTDGIDSFDLEAAQRLRAALDSRASWSGIEVAWPIGAGDAVIPVTMGAAAQFGAGRAFDGFRGFGVADLARLAARARPPGESIVSAPAAAPHPVVPADPGAVAPPADPGPVAPPAALEFEPAALEPATALHSFERTPPEAWAVGRTPRVSVYAFDPAGGLASEATPAAAPDGEAPSGQDLEVEPTPHQYVDGQANVVRLWPAPGPARVAEPGGASNAAHDPGDAEAPDLWVDAPNSELAPAHHDQSGERNGALTSSEHSAFREIALVLGAAYPEPSPEQPGDSAAPDVAEAEPLAQDMSPAQEPPLEASRDDDLDRSAAGIVDTLPLGLMVLRGSAVLYANRALLDALHCAELSDLPPDLGEVLARGLPAGGAPVAVDVPIADGTKVALLAEGRPAAWNGEDAALWLLRPPREGEARSTPPAAPAEAGATDARQLGALVDAASDAFATIDDAGRILTLNRQGERWFGQDRRRLAGESFTLLLAPESRATAAALLAEVKASNDPGAELARETLARAPDGTSLPLQMALARIGTGVFSAAWRDLSAQKRLERDMARAKREADRASSQQPEFLAKVSHEIRTPLNAILGFAEIMIDERFGPLGNPRYKDYLRDIHTSGTQVMNLVNDLLDLSRIEAGRLDLDLAPVDLNRVIGACVAEMHTQAHRERVIMRTSLGARLPAITADEKSVRQIVVNLLSNAIRYNEPGGQVIVSSALNDAGAVVVRIKDTGIGMSDADIAAALEPFRQLSASKQAGGTGLGLPLTKALAGANGASLSIRSRPREGTMVEVTFPAAPAPAARVPA